MAELVFFAGTMDCGKSTLALQMDHNHRARGQVGVIFTRLDRAGGALLSSRLGLATPATEVGADLDPRAHRPTRADRRRTRRRGLRLRDHERLPHATLSGSRRLIELADRTAVLQVAALCWCGRRATHNARVVDGVMVVHGEQVILGDTVGGGEAEVEYEVLCRRHHLRRMNSRTARAAASSADVLPFA